ncbi:MAG: hypothetical protein MRZ84_10540, partial [Eubacterium sp.]|nr:hypothetical protein [Eubacterium sp.]
DVINKVTGTNIEYEESEEVVNMCRAWDNSMTKAREEGHSAGLKEGISTTKAVFKAYISGKSAEEIAKELEIPLEEVEEVLG